MKNKYNPPSLDFMCFPAVDVMEASGGTFGTVGDYEGDFLD